MEVKQQTTNLNISDERQQNEQPQIQKPISKLFEDLFGITALPQTEKQENESFETPDNKSKTQQSLIDIDISEIIQSSILSQDQIEQFNQLQLDLAVNMKNVFRDSQINNIFIIIMNNIQNFNSSLELQFLDIIQHIVDCDKYNLDQNAFYNTIQQSGLLKKLVIIIKRKISFEQNQNKINSIYSEIVQQLIYIYIQIMKGKRIKTKMFQRCIKVFEQSSKNVLGSIKLQDQEKQSYADELYENMKMKDKKELIDLFNNGLLFIISNRINNFSTQYEGILLNIIELLVDRFRSQIYESLHSSGILNKIKQNIEQMVCKEEKENKNPVYSDVVERLVCIYIKISKEKYIQTRLKIPCKKVYDKSNSVIFYINKLNEQDKEQYAQIIFEDLKTKNNDELIKIFDFWMLLAFQKCIGDCSTQYQRRLLIIIEFVNDQIGKKIMNDLKQSGIIERIEQIIIENEQKEDKENNNQTYSEYLEWVVNVYIKIIRQQSVNSKMNQPILNVIDRSYSNIIGSNLLNEQERIKKAKSLFEEIKLKDKQQIMQIFDYWIFLIIINRLINLDTISQLTLLDIIEMIFNKVNYFLIGQAQQSGLPNKIKELLEQKANEDEKNGNQSYSQIVDQLIRIYLQLIKYTNIDNRMSDLIIQIMNSNILVISNGFKDFVQRKQNKKEIEINNQQFIINLKETTKTIKLFELFGEMRDYNQTFKKNLENFIIEKIAPFIHFNCSQELNCPFSLTIPITSDVIELQQYSLQSLNLFQINNLQFKDLINNHNIISHIYSYIISMKSINQIKNQINIQKHSFISNYLNITSTALELLRRIIYHNKDNCQLVITSSHESIKTLMNMYNFKLNNQFGQNLNKEVLQVRNNCRQCVNEIQLYSGLQVQQELIQYKYINELIISINSYDQYQLEYNYQIQEILRKILSFIQILQCGRKIQIYNEDYYYYHSYESQDYPSIEPQNQFIRLVEEQIEEECGMEQFDKYSKVKYFMCCSDGALKVKEIIMNRFVDKTNPNYRYYY